MKLDKINLSKEKNNHSFLIYISIIIIISLILIVLRILFYFFQDDIGEIFFLDLLIKNRDLNFKTNYELMDNGIIYYYENSSSLDKSAMYLYFWYYLYYPFYIIPLDISLYIWDLLRFISTLYIAFKIRIITENKKDLFFFFVFSGFGYLADMYLNNTNWLIQFFLFESYIQINRNRKWLSGILFTFATFKIIILVVPFILIVINKIKTKNVIYYFLPLLLVCIPYLIFPHYFLSMIFNWFQSISIGDNISFIDIFLNIWRLIQPAHLMFISIIVLFMVINIKNELKKKKIELFIYITIFIFWILIWIIILELALFI